MLKYVLAVCCWGLLSIPAFAGSIDNTGYAELLTQYVSEQGLVDYGGLKGQEVELDIYLRTLEDVVPDKLNKDEQLAYYINVYNAWTLKLILSAWPDITSIKQLGTLFTSPWEKEIVRLNGKVVTLDDIEHGIIRPRFQDARIHFAVNCSAVSCPPILREPYVGERLQEQLDGVARHFLNNPKNYRVEGNKIFVTKLLDWYDEDFTPDVRSFMLQFADEHLAKALGTSSSPRKIAFMTYDWALNKQ